MTTALEQKLQNLADRPLTEGEMALAVRDLTGAVDCLIKMYIKVISEGGNINTSFDERAGRRTQFARPKYTPIRLC